MKTFRFCHAVRLLTVFPVLLAAGLVTLAAADEHGMTIPDPGYRPDSEQSGLFLEAVGNTTIAVLPTMIHRLERTAHSFDSQQVIVDFLNGNQIGKATSNPLRVDQGILERRSQWDLFNRGIGAVAAALTRQAPDADYTLAMEILVPGDQAVFGIHVYILDKQGRSAFSFLLNSHHQLFTEAGLVASDTSEDERHRMIMDATNVGLRALQAQITDAKECARRSKAPSTPAQPSVLHDFDSALASGTDEYGVPVGYSTFAGPNSVVRFDTTHSHPARDGEAAGNNTLKISLEVGSWGGVINRFASETLDEWVPQDWRELEGFSFWFHGENSGAPIFVDIFDNRRPCSRTDDAERFRYRFMDDVSGWREIKVRLDDLEHWNVNNNAPDDGLGLDRVHGWGIGTSNAEGAVRTTFYLDDFRLIGELPDAFSASDGLLKHGKLTELPIDDRTSRIETSTRGAGRPVGYEVIDLMCACVSLTLERDYSYFRIDERETLNGDRARFRLTFYDERPADLPVLDVPEPGSMEVKISMSGAIPAEQMQVMCQQSN